MTGKNQKPDQLQVQIRELNRIYSKSLHLIEQSKNPEKLLDALLEEYEDRFEELIGLNLSSDPESIDDPVKREKMKALHMFTKLAEVLQDNAKMQIQLKSRNLELDKLYNQQSQVNEDLRKLNAHYLNMLGFVSHELRSPLISILGFAELLEEGFLGDLNMEQQNGVQVITRVARNLIDMIRNYLDLSKIEHGELKIQCQKVNLNRDLLQPVLTELTSQLSLHDMKITRSEKHKNIHTELIGDPDLLKVVFMNLFSNAIKYGKANSSIEYEIDEREDTYHLSVLNYGRGVPKDRIQNVFDKFSQPVKPDPDLPRGTGLGLFNTRCIIEAHGGKIWAESEDGKWFKVQFFLPKKPIVENENVNLTTA